MTNMVASNILPILLNAVHQLVQVFAENGIVTKARAELRHVVVHALMKAWFVESVRKLRLVISKV